MPGPWVQPFLPHPSPSPNTKLAKPECKANKHKWQMENIDSKNSDLRSHRHLVTLGLTPSHPKSQRQSPTENPRSSPLSVSPTCTLPNLSALHIGSSHVIPSLVSCSGAKNGALRSICWLKHAKKKQKGIWFLFLLRNLVTTFTSFWG